jgi:hypothetical protein
VHDNPTKVKGAVDWSAENVAYVALWNQRQAHQMYYLSGVVHWLGPYKEYLRWLHLQSKLLLKPAYTEEHIAQLCDCNEDNEIIDEYNTITRQGTQQLERGPFQNYVVFIFPYFHYPCLLEVKFLILTNVA